MSEFVYGRHAVEHLIKAKRRRVLKLFLQKGLEERENDLLSAARAANIPVEIQPPAFFSNKSNPQATHQGVMALTEGYPYVPVDQLFTESLLLIADEIQDVHNLGALCRSAHLFGVGGIILPETQSASIGPGTCQSAVGAVEYLKIARVSSVAKVLEVLKENSFWTYGADAEAGKPLHEEAFPKKVALVIGSEEKGLRKLVRERCDILLKIPMEGRKIGSFNASVAAGILLYEVSRQKLSKSKENS